MRTFFQWSRNFIIILIVLLISIALFNYSVDPYQKYRITDFYKFEEKKQREILPGLAKHLTYDSIIIGSSMTENFRPEQINEIFKTKTIKLSMAGAYAHELNILLNYVFSRKKIKQIIYVLDPYSLAGSPTRIHTEHMPLYMYSDSIKANVTYLLDKETTRRSMKSITKYRNKKNDFNRLWYWADLETFSEASVVAKLQNKPVYSSFNKQAHSANTLIDSFKVNIQSLLKEHSDTKFIFIYPPYSALSYANMQEKGWLTSVGLLKAYVLKTSQAYDNVSVYDFQCNSDIVEDLNNYKDYTHYSGKINDYMIEAVAQGQYLSTSNNIDQCLNTIETIASKPKWHQYFH